MVGFWVLLAVLVVALAAGFLLKSRDGRIRPAKRAAHTGAGEDTETPVAASTTADRAGRSAAAHLPAPVAEVLDAGAAVTLVQISTTFCAPCRHTRALLSALADKTPGLRHVDLDVTNQPEVAQALSVLRTPTTLALTPDGRELLRVGGLPKGPELLEALRPHLAATG
ncbi:TlpA family protein disulfide reductase [Amycolatopsis jiangsuensis]|uniref:Thiol-disulfide isomerase/thioredoxin n=1 Tax=Amycolatopsis jiangsuensis TaxID=1181879 RepID=A0A840IY38_9PSEU|nr:thioredoxin family protein [Amycolatopsis jiangsuensis]MBB4687576.1 thiol-disulfide isomerase/thioredoxin [Amycolatopsis jiangsuensis]